MDGSRAVLIDSSAWIEFFRATGGPAHLELRRRIESGAELATTGPVAMELLAGAGAGAGAEVRLIRGVLGGCRMLRVRVEDWEGAAGVYAECRRAGSTPRRLLDCLIAAVAIRAGTPVLARDRDFTQIARHTALELAGR